MVELELPSAAGSAVMVAMIVVASGKPRKTGRMEPKGKTRTETLWTVKMRETCSFLHSLCSRGWETGGRRGTVTGTRWMLCSKSGGSGQISVEQEVELQRTFLGERCLMVERSRRLRILHYLACNRGRRGGHAGHIEYFSTVLTCIVRSEFGGRAANGAPRKRNLHQSAPKQWRLRAAAGAALRDGITIYRSVPWSPVD